MNVNVNQKTGLKALYKALILKYMNLAYLFGSYLDRKSLKKLSSMLYQADIEMTAGMFLSICLMSAAIVGILTFIFSALALTYIVKTPLALPLAAGIGAASFAAVCAGFFFVLINKINTKKIEIEREMPFALSYMSIMSSAGSTPLKVISTLSIQNYGFLSSELRKMGYRVYFLGEDAVTAINNLANNTPSNIFRDTCIELGNIIHSGTGMMEFLEERSRELIELRRITLKQFMDDLSLFSELYLLISMANIIAVIGIPLTAVFGIQLGFLNAEAMFMLFTFILLPLANILFLAILEVKYSSLP